MRRYLAVLEGELLGGFQKALYGASWVARALRPPQRVCSQGMTKLPRFMMTVDREIHRCALKLILVGVWSRQKARPYRPGDSRQGRTSCAIDAARVAGLGRIRFSFRL